MNNAGQSDRTLCRGPDARAPAPDEDELEYWIARAERLNTARLKDTDGSFPPRRPRGFRQPLPSSLRSQAFPSLRCRSTVAGEIPSASAVSS